MDKINLDNHWQPERNQQLFSAIVDKINEIVDELNTQKEDEAPNPTTS